MKESDKISVLVCVHSRDHEHDVLLQRALESLVRQTYPNFETIVVLDECWEDTKGLVKNYASVLDIRIFERTHKQGLAAAKNFGIARCTGDWIAYLDADDQWMDCKLEVQRNYLLEHDGIDLCFTESWDLFDGVMRPNCFMVGQYQTHVSICKALPNENVLCHGSALIRKSALDGLGGYSTSKALLGREDWHMWQRAVEAGFTLWKIPERLYVYSLGTGVPR